MTTDTLGHQTPTPMQIVNRLRTLAAPLEQTARMASWRERSVAALLSTNRHEGLILATQIQREVGAIDADMAFHVIGLQAETIAWDGPLQHDAELTRLGEAIQAAERAYGLAEDQYWTRGEAPQEVETLQTAWEKRAREIEAQVLRDRGEDAMADLLLASPDEYAERMERGLRKFHGRRKPTPPAQAGDAGDTPSFGSGLAWLLILGAGVAGNALEALVFPGMRLSVGASTAGFGALGLLVAHRAVQRARRWHYAAPALREFGLPVIAGLSMLAILGSGPRSDLPAHALGMFSGACFGSALGASAIPRLPAWCQRALELLVLAVVMLAWRAAFINAAAVDG